MTFRPLRILYSAPVFPKTSETFVTDQILGLAHMGHRIDVFAPKMGQISDAGLRAGLRQAVGRIMVPPGTTTRGDEAWLQARSAPAWTRPDTWRSLARVLTSPGFRRQRFPLRRGAALLDAPPYDAVVCHFGPAGVALQQFREVGLLRAPLVTIFHGYDITNYLTRVPPEFYDQLFAHGDLFLPISDRWLQRLGELGCPPERTQRHRLGTDLSTFTHAVRQPAAGEPVRILSVARLVQKKGIEFGIRAVAILTAQGIPVVYDIVGDGPLRADLEELTADLNLGDQVNFHGARAHAEVAALMRERHILLVPSVTDDEGGMEGIPVVIMEAMATGLLVIASRHSGIPEIVRDQVTGALIAEKDSAGIAQAVQALSRDLAGWSEILGRAQALVRADYDLARQNQGLVTMLLNLSNGAGD